MMDFSRVTEWKIPEGNCSVCKKGDQVLWQGYDSYDKYVDFYSLQPFSCTFTRNDGASTPFPLIQYTSDREKWNRITEGMTMNSEVDDSGIHHIILRGEGNSDINGNFSLASASGTSIGCRGEITTLLSHSKVKKGQVIDCGKRAFYQIFAFNHLLISAPDITTEIVGYEAFRGAFKQTSVTAAPSLLSVKEVKEAGFYEMFEGCEELVTCSAMWRCWDYGKEACGRMYYNCKKMNTIPVLFEGEVHSYVGKYAFEDFMGFFPDGSHQAPLTGLNSTKSAKYINEYTLIDPSLDISYDSTSFKSFASVSRGDVGTPVPYTQYYTNAEIIR